MIQKVAYRVRRREMLDRDAPLLNGVGGGFYRTSSRRLARQR